MVTINFNRPESCNSSRTLREKVDAPAARDVWIKTFEYYCGRLFNHLGVQFNRVTNRTTGRRLLRARNKDRPGPCFVNLVNAARPL